MDSSQSPSHNGINATTQESGGGRKKNIYPTPLSEMFARDQKSVQYKKKTQGGTKTSTKQANGTAHDLYFLR